MIRRFCLPPHALAAGLLLTGATIATSQPPPEPVKIAGSVVNALTGAPIPGAWVTLSRQPGPAQRPLQRKCVTDAAGAFVAPNMPEGRYTLSASAAGFASASKTCELTAGMKPVVLGLTPFSVIRGRILRPDGAPLRLKRVSLIFYRTQVESMGGASPYQLFRAMRTLRTTTDGEGRYQVETSTQGEFLVCAACPDEGVGTSALHVGRGGDVIPDVDVKLTSGQSVRLRAVDEKTREPVPDVRARLTSAWMGVLFQSTLGSTPFKYARDGEVVFTGLAPGHYRFQVESIQSARAALLEVILFPGEQERIVTVSLPRQNPLTKWRVRVLGDDGAPLARTPVRVILIPVPSSMYENGYELARTTDSEGMVEILLATRRPWYSWISTPKAGVSDPITVTAKDGNEAPAEVTLHAPCSVSGRVLDEYDRPAAALEVKLMLSAPSARFPFAGRSYVSLPTPPVLTDAQGRYEFSLLPRGVYFVNLSKQTIATTRYYPFVRLRSGDHRKNLDFQVIRKGVTISGRIWEPGRKRTMANLSLCIVLLDRPQLPATVLWSRRLKVQDGMFHVDHVLPRAGHLLFLGWEPGYALTERIDLKSKPVWTGLEVELKPGGAISVAVAPKDSVTLYQTRPDRSPAPPPFPALGGRNGDHYDFKGLPPGDYWLCVNGDTTHPLQCRVKVGETTRVTMTGRRQDGAGAPRR